MFYLMLVIGVVVTALLAFATALLKLRSFSLFLVLDFVVTFGVLYAVGVSSFTHASGASVAWASFAVALALTVLLAIVRALDRRGFAPRIFVAGPRTPTGTETR